ncbi:DUF397 domain-containing protein [Nocardiopsis dassonvillei subsp. albirubida]|uniref:DUF397 domain-containing protein n=1 Tax=Nocardiopsis alborubida TaxID=146802 RepID=A0A7X6M9T0_9ACTN|nr:DUF397 domain-containing protein [Nocardiopsis alborubida]
MDTWVNWRKSTYSGGSGGQCAEIGQRPDGSAVAIRDTKTPDQEHLPFSRSEWNAMLGAVKGH